MLPDYVTDLKGRIRAISVFQVEKGAIRKYADAVEDGNPLYWDEDYARDSRYGAMIAPPGFFGWPSRWVMGDSITTNEDNESRSALTKAGYARTHNGGIEYEFYKPVRAGDILVASLRITDFVEKETKRTGKMVLVFTETMYMNQGGDPVAKEVMIRIHVKDA
jgi:acyl dehydratase